jgi:hypothetical protein
VPVGGTRVGPELRSSTHLESERIVGDPVASGVKGLSPNCKNLDRGRVGDIFLANGQKRGCRRSGMYRLRLLASAPR